MDYCSDQMNLQRFMEPIDQATALRQHLVVARGEVQKVEAQLERVTDALLAGESEGAAPLAFVRKARELEQELQARQAAVLQLERELAGLARYQSPADAARWASLADGVMAQDAGAREQVRQMVMDTFLRIVVYLRGIRPAGRKAPFIDVLLISRSGQRRWMRLDRKSGEWVAGNDSGLE